jgi:hypothetical protein
MQNFFIILTTLIISVSCNQKDVSHDSDKTPKPNAIKSKFIDVAAESEMKFIYNTGSSGATYLAEIVGGGAALFDCDNDGDLDVLFTQGTEISSQIKNSNAQPKLFRNNLTQVNGKIQLSFSDITHHSGIQSGEYGTGVAAADINNDGFVDVYLTNFGKNRLLQNLGDCRFEEIDNQAQDSSWSVSSSFLDYQPDGLLDLFVGNYVNHSNTYNKTCTNSAGQVDYCGPKAYKPVANSFWENTGEMTFKDISNQSGINQSYGGALGVISADFNQDGLLDIYVTNDQRPNLLWENSHDGTFENVAMFNGCAVNSSGLAEASMGVDLGDVDNDGDLDLFMTHLRKETNTFFEMKDGQCFDHSNKSDLAAPSVPYTGFGTGFLDIENDGDLDVFVANGEIERINEQVQRGDPFPLKQKNQLFENNGFGKFTDISLDSGDDINSLRVSRGAAFGDIDNDGDTDILVINSNDPAQLLLNNIGQDNNWIGFVVYNKNFNRSAIGAMIEITLLDDSRRIERIASDGSYAVANDPRPLFGLDKDESIKEATVHWLNGEKTTYKNIKSGHYYRFTQDEINVLSFK